MYICIYTYEYVCIYFEVLSKYIRIRIHIYVPVAPCRMAGVTLRMQVIYAANVPDSELAEGNAMTKLYIYIYIYIYICTYTYEYVCIYTFKYYQNI